jgi:hypothetical protein
MIDAALEQRVAALRATSLQRWLLGVIAVIGPCVVCAITRTGPVLALVVPLAVASAVRPDSHIGLFVIAITVWCWLARIDDAASPLALVAALSLFVYHASLALMSTMPSSGSIDPAVLTRWIKRSVPVAAATVAVWGLVAAMRGRGLVGNVTLSVAAMVVIAIAAIAARVRSLGEPAASSPPPAE